MADKLIEWADLRLPIVDDPEDVARRLDKLYEEESETREVVDADGTVRYMVLGDGYVPNGTHAKVVGAFAALGVRKEEIADLLSMPLYALERYYKRELETSSTVANAAVAQVALNAALDGKNTDMTKFWLKTRAGWRDAPKQVEVSGPGGGPIVIDSARAKLAQALNMEADETGNVVGPAGG